MCMCIYAYMRSCLCVYMYVHEYIISTVLSFVTLGPASLANFKH